jgi:hypothetical protein
MNKYKGSAGLKRLLAELADVEAKDASAGMVDHEMLSLMVNRVLNGEDIAKRYPTFYRKLLGDTDLREAFLDALEAIETERTNRQLPSPFGKKAELTFLGRQRTQPVLELRESHQWRTTWQTTLEQIQAIFSPSELAYRSSPGLLEDPWFPLLRDEIKIEGSTYAVALECTLADIGDILSAYLNLAVTLGTNADKQNFPIQANLHWGDYQESILIMEEGRARFPDIALDKVLDESQQNIRSGLTLVIETTS